MSIVGWLLICLFPMAGFIYIGVRDSHRVDDILQESCDKYIKCKIAENKMNKEEYVKISEEYKKERALLEKTESEQFRNLDEIMNDEFKTKRTATWKLPVMSFVNLHKSGGKR